MLWELKFYMNHPKKKLLLKTNVSLYFENLTFGALLSIHFIRRRFFNHIFNNHVTELGQSKNANVEYMYNY